MKIVLASKPGIRVFDSTSLSWRALAGLFLLLLSLLVFSHNVSAGETFSTDSKSVTVGKSVSVSPTVKEYLCGGCNDDEGLDSECWFEGDICLEREDVRLYMNSRHNQNSGKTMSVSSKSEFVLMVYMVDYLFNSGAHLSNENLAALIDQKPCPEINIDCLSRTVHRVLSIDATTIEPSTR